MRSKSAISIVTAVTLLAVLLYQVSSLQASSPVHPLFQSPLGQSETFKSPLPKPTKPVRSTPTQSPETVFTLFVSPLSEPPLDAPHVSVTMRKGAGTTYHDPLNVLGQPSTTTSPPSYLPAGMVAVLPPSGGGSSGGTVASDPDLVDNWERLAREHFELGWIYPPCTVYYDPVVDAYWQGHHYRPFPADGSFMAGWPAAGGEDAVDPSVSDYLANMNTWIVCGPFVLSQKENFMVQFANWLEVNDADDGFDFGIANHLEGPYQWWGMPTSGDWPWTIFDVWLTDWAGDDVVYVAWQFWSDGDGNWAEGAWLDELKIWRYDMPAATCGDVDPGNKGVVLDAYDPTTDGEHPMIRPGETIAVGDLVAADARWVRMVFEQKNGAVDLLAYDRMVDTLCANGISVLGILNHQTLFRQDVNEPATAEDYRQEFAGAASFIAEHFQGRISYWEVWNEENYDPVDNGQPDMPFVRPEFYAPLLNEACQAIRNATEPDANVLFGGLGSAWNDSRDYLVDVYNAWGGSGPFDHFAVHPYFDNTHGLDPAVYIHADPGYDTILDKFMETMHGRGDGSKKTWVTEVGWTSSDGDPNAACLAPVDVTAEQQKAYLKTGFDILFNEVDLWGRPWVRAVDKAFWYQYMDVGLPYEEACPGGAAGGMSWKGYVPAGGLLAGVTGQSSGLPDVPWWFGLYHGLKRTPKPVQCAFMAYPRECQQVFLPLTLKNH